MKVIYNPDLLIAGIGVAPWTRLGLERWFPDYKIVAYREGGAHGLANMPEILLLGDTRLAKKTTSHIVHSKAFAELANGVLAGYKFMAYKPVVIKDEALRMRFLMNDPAHSQTYENKAWLRETFGATLPFAPYRIFDRSELVSSATAHEKLEREYTSFVMQHEQLSGGRGTYIVRDFDTYQSALANLPGTGRVVVSSFLEGAVERSVQCCATQYGVVYGGMQKQIVRSPVLCNLNVPVVNGFCGGEIGTAAASPAQQKAIDTCVQTIGAHMYKNGFKGIFGADFMVRGDEVYLLEINARSTGMTPLLTALYQDGKDVPFYLLQALELMGADYSAEGFEGSTQSSRPGSLLLLQSQFNAERCLTTVPPSGVYGVDGGRLELLRRDSRFDASDPIDAVLVQNYVSPGTTVKPGDKLLGAMTRQTVLDGDDELNDASLRLVTALYSSIE